MRRSRACPGDQLLRTGAQGGGLITAGLPKVGVQIHCYSAMEVGEVLKEMLVISRGLAEYYKLTAVMNEGYPI